MDKKAVFQDALIILNKFKQFKPRTRVFTNAMGKSDLLLNLYGILMPTPSIQIPITIWIPRNYPAEPPSVIIDLENLKDCKIILSKNLNTTGEIFLPIQNIWDRNHSTLELLIHELFLLLEKIPLVQPVIDTTQKFADLTISNSSERAQPIPPSLPEKHVPFTAIFTGSSMSSNTVNSPPLPPKPKLNTTQLLQNPPSPNDKIPIQRSQLQDTNSFLSQRNVSSQLLSNQSFNNSIRQNSSTNTISPNISTTASLTNISVASINSKSIPPEKPPGPPPIDFLTGNNELLSNDSLKDKRHEVALESLLNTLKFLNENEYTNKIEKEHFLRKQAIRDALKQFQDIYNYEYEGLNEIKRNITLKRAKLDEQKKYLQTIKNKINDFEEKNPETIDPNDLVTAETVAINQLYELVATDYALTDAIQLLTRFLQEKNINLDYFLKKNRELARKQFITRAHIKKITKYLVHPV